MLEAQICADGFATFGQPTRVGPLVVNSPSRRRGLSFSDKPPLHLGRAASSEISGRWRRMHETVDLTLDKAYTTHGADLALVSAETGKIAGSPPSPPASRFGFEPR